MSKYCPDINCVFWKDFPHGLVSDRAQMCPFCREELLPHDPRGLADQFQIEMTVLIPPNASIPLNVKSEPQTDSEPNSNLAEDTHSSEKPDVVWIKSELDSEEEIGGQTDTKCENTRKRTDSHLSEPDNEASKRRKCSTHDSNSQQNPICSYSDHSDSSQDTDEDSSSVSSKSKSHPNTGNLDDSSKTSEGATSPRRSKRLEEKAQSHILSTVSGSSIPETTCVAIQFNTLILKEFYSKIDSVSLRVLDRVLEKSQSTICMKRVKEVSTVSGEFVTLCGTLHYPKICIWGKTIKFPYGYFFHDRFETSENLHHPHYHSNSIRRYFKMSTYAMDGDTYEHFDLMILPEIPKNTQYGITGFIQSALDFARLISTDNEVPFFLLSKRRLCSLLVFLPSCLDNLNRQNIHSLEDYLRQFQYVVNCLADCSFQIMGGSGNSSIMKSWDSSIDYSTNNLVIDWILATCDNNSSSTPKSKLCIFYLACYLLVHQYKIKNEYLDLKLLNMIVESMEPILAEKLYEFDNLTELSIENDLRLLIRDSVTEFLFMNVMNGKHYKQLLRLLPIYHCMNSVLEHPLPYHELNYQDLEYWGFPNHIRLTFRDTVTFPEIKTALCLVKYDSILPYSILIYSLNTNNAKTLCEHFLTILHQFPLSAFMNALLLRLTRGQFLRPLSTELFKCLISTFRESSDNLDVSDINQFNLLTLTFLLKLSPLPTQQLFDLSLELFSRGLEYCDSRSIEPLITSTQFQTFFNEFVKKWFNIHISKDEFLYSVFVNEVKFWQHFTADYSFPKSTALLEMTREFLANRITDRGTIAHQYIIDIFLIVHKENYCQLLQEVFLKELTTRLQVIAPGEKCAFVDQLYHEMSDPGQLKQLVDVFSGILLDEKRNFEENPVNHLFTWPSWKTWFELFVSNKNEEMISSEAKELLNRALDEFSSLCQCIQNFEITIINIEHIDNNSEYFLSLSHIVSKIISTHSVQDTESGLRSCLSRSRWVQKQRGLLKQLYDIFDNLQNVDNAFLSDFLDIIEHETIADICVLKEDSFSLCDEFAEMNNIIHFTNFESICNIGQSIQSSSIITQVFNRKLRFNNQTRFDINLFCQEIWVPSWNKCSQLLSQLADESILISEMCQYFDNTLRTDDISTQLTQLYSSCNKYDNNPRRQLQFDSCTKKISLYFQLQQCSEAARLIYQLRDVLSIKEKEDYDVINHLRNISVSFDNKHLSEMNTNVNKTADYLSELTDLGVIRVFIEKIAFVDWIRDNLKDLNELKTFVDICLTTCGDSPVDIDRITCLSSVCTNFAPLIFRIDQNTNCSELIARCIEVIGNVDKNKTLTKLLREVGDSVSFWEEMKRSHGSVEETTLMQLHSITDHGVFCLSVGESLTLSNMISLRVERDHAECRIYKLEHLTEFRSKLMLVVGKSDHIGQHTDSYIKSHQFTHKLDLLTEIAAILIQLIESGNQNYQNYKITSIVNEKESLGSLATELSSLTNKFNSWKQKIEEARDKYYFLNYYTISQIVSIQKGVLSFVNDEGNSDLEQLYHLLGLINQDITREDIHQALELAGNAPKHITRTTDHDFSRQSLSAAISSQYSHIHQTNLSPTNTNSHFIQTHNGFVDFPDTFSQTEIEIAQSVSDTADLSLKLTIKGILELNAIESIVSEGSLLEWCFENESDFLPSTLQTPGTDAESLPALLSYTQSSSEDTNTDFYNIGRFLESIYNTCGTKLRAKRDIPYTMKTGTPNLVAVPTVDIFNFVLSLYCTEKDRLPLPYYHEILICTSDTKLEELEIFWRRSIVIPDMLNLYLFCVIGIENLQYDIAVKAVMKCKQIQQLANPGYRLVLVCSEEREESSYMAAVYEHLKISITHKVQSDDLRRFLKRKLSHFSQCSRYSCRPAWEVDREKYKARLVVSDSVGAGKSLYISNLKSDLLDQGIDTNEEIEQAVVTVSVHGKRASEEDIAAQLLRHEIRGREHGVMYHVDIASTVVLGLEPILFKLIILGGLCKRSGELWNCKGTDYYVIEMTLPLDTRFTNIYPQILCTQPYEAIDTGVMKSTQGIDLEELRKEKYTRVNEYLIRLESNTLDNFTFNPSAMDHIIDLKDNLRRFMRLCGVTRPSWSEIRNFVTFLDKQLLDCDNSDYCRPDAMTEEWIGFKKFVVKFMILMSRDFATPSLRGTAQQDSSADEADDGLSEFKMCERRRWENSSHPYIFFHPDGHTMTFLGFHVSNEGNLIDSDDPTIILERNIIHPDLFQVLQANRVDLREDYHKLDKTQKILKIAGVMALNWISDPDPGYVLTLDNMRKILAILMRFRCNIPVVVMGETGCGKTRLIQFMCSLQAMPIGAKNMLILKVHGGTTEQDVINKVEEAEELAVNNYEEHKIDTVLFFDEANTSPVIGLIKEIMCDRRMYGRRIRSDIKLQFIAACNPYRKHTVEMLNKLSTAGLGFFTKASQTTDRLGDIPLRELVYRVMELPASMRPLVWDFGQLSDKIERSYTREIVLGHVKSSLVPFPDDCIDVISDVLAGAQHYMRSRKDECSFVSLRDVERAMRVMIWFYSNLEHFAPGHEDSEVDDSSTSHERIGQLTEPELVSSTHNVDNRTINDIDFITYSLILSLAVCYRARLEEREEFDKYIIRIFKRPLTEIKRTKLIKEIDRCQQLILDEMTVGTNIAKNKALKENVFMMFVCIELKIPLFVVGKPGSSKSLAKSIISNSMQGSRSPGGSILQHFKQVQIMSFQCSQLSTADGIIGVFRSCRNLQRKTGGNKFVACVVLDEVGLAEDSPLLPLKVLHPLLEDNSYGSEQTDDELSGVDRMDTEMWSIRKEIQTIKESEEMKDRVAFIGISNWSLDPAKMNRGIMVSRGDPDLSELEESAKGICKTDGGGSILSSIANRIRHLGRAYLKLTGKKNKIHDEDREYFGLRDFYSLIKMLMFLCTKYNTKLNRDILQHVVKRNFGGVSDVDPVQIFQEAVRLPADDGGKSPDSSTLGLIRANLVNLSRSFHGETRYLLLLTENYAALNILLRSPDMWPNQNESIRVIFGSSFPRDQEYSAVCSNINRIKVCMETGKTVILLNLENLYESLYDVLNQYYMEMNDQRYVDLGLGIHRMKCRVHNEFKLIVVADKETVQEKFPTPLINRLEKHFLTTATVLSSEGVDVSDQLSEWAKLFSALDKSMSIGLQRRANFTEGDCFIGFHTETPSSIVFHVLQEMYSDLGDMLDCIDKEAVLERSQIKLLRMTTTDAVFRVRNSLLSTSSQQITTEYFKLKLGSLEEYLIDALQGLCRSKTGVHLTLATTHSRLLTDRDVEQLKERLSSETSSFDLAILSLQQFQTEHQYTREIQEFLKKGTVSKKVLLVQCERGADNAKLIASARHKAADELTDWIDANPDMNCDVYLIFLIQLCREAHGSKFVSFCGGDWDTVHIDDIRSLDYTELPPISHLIDTQIYEMFGESYMETNSDFNHFCEKKKLRDCIQPAASRLEDSTGSEDCIVSRIQNIILLIENNNNEFVTSLCVRVRDLLKEQHDSSFEDGLDWIHQTANCGEGIQSSGTFRKAVSLRINNAITPLLSELLALLDRNSNLELALSEKGLPASLVDLWHSIFRDPEVLVLKYRDVVSPSTMCPRVRVPVLNDGAGGKYFKAHFPFSWLINQCCSQLFAEMNSARLQGADSDGKCARFESLFNETPLGKKISNIIRDDKNKLIEHYLRDFIHMNVFGRDIYQHKVYRLVLLNCISGIEDGITSFTDENISIPRIHYAFENSKHLIDLLKQSFSYEGRLAVNLYTTLADLKEKRDEKLKCIELVVLEEITNLCSYKKELTCSKALAEKYVSEIKQCQSVMERGFSFKHSDELSHAYRQRIRCNWDRIMAVQLFISYCTLTEFKVAETSINRLYVILSESSDFTSVQVIKQVLSVLSNYLQRTRGMTTHLKKQFKSQATRFFISILTNLTFKYLKVGESNLDLIKLLMGFVTLDEKYISELLTDRGSIQLFTEEGLDPSPAFRTFLLQLLIKHRQDVFKEEISVYLRDKVLNYTHDSLKRNLILLIIQSIEDSLHQQFNLNRKKLERQLKTINIDYLADNTLSYDFLERIATLRFLCIHISQCIVETYNLSPHVNKTHLPNSKKLIYKFKNICLMEGFEYVHTFLLKNIYHLLGSDTLYSINKCPDCQWIIPEHVHDEMIQIPVMIPDYFIIYGEDYIRITSAVEQVNLIQNKNALLQFFNSDTNPDPIHIECFIYSIFQEVVKLLRKRQATDSHSLDQALHTLKAFIRTGPLNMNSELSYLALQIATNKFGDERLCNLEMKPTSTNHQIFLVRLIFHGAVMLCSGNYHKLLLPISRIYTDPASLRGKLFPTMIDDQFVYTKYSIQDRGKWYECPNGHPYFIGECGRPVVRDKCPDCGSRVGGINHKPVELNTELDMNRDETKTDYLLGRVNEHSVSSGERTLGPAAVKILRALMDITFIWSSCSKDCVEGSNSEYLLYLVKAVDNLADLSEFFFQHLERDIQDLARHTGQNFEEATFLIHLVIKSLIQRGNETCRIPTDLTQRELRDQWEIEFSKQFIQPVLSSIHTQVRTQMEQVLNEKRIANNPLLRLVFEREEPEADNVLPHLWRHRSIVSLEHFSQSFSTADSNTQQSCPLVHKFLREESKLCVTRYLPDIVQLQRRVRDRLVHRIDRREATDTNIRHFLDKVRQEDRREYEELGRLIESLATAWSKIREDVRNNGRIRMEESLNTQEITPATCLAFLLPSSTGEGLLITSLTDYLVLVHNSFVHAYRDRATGSRNDTISLCDLEARHMIEYQEQVYPLLLSQAHYSLALGQGSHVTYDFEAVERELMDQFIQSKPLIVTDHLRFEYNREARSDVFEQVRDRVKQTEVREVLWRAILEDLDSLEVVSDVLRVLDVVIGILSSAGGDPEQKLSSYLVVLGYPSSPHGVGPLQSRRAEGVLCVKHILSFWSLLSIERAGKLSILGQIPFSSLSDEFQRKLSEKEKKQIERSFDRLSFLDHVLTYLHEFIVFFLSERGSEEKDYGLVESITVYAENTGTELPAGLSHLHKGIKLSQTAAVWALLAQRRHRIAY